MYNLREFVKLDYFTVKPYFTGKNLLIYGAMVLFLTIMSADISAGIGIGMMLATMHTGYPFVAGEKCNMDALYVSLSVGKKTVVLGRYIFTLLLNICIVLVVVAFTMIVMLVYGILGNGFQTAAGGGVLLIMPALFMIMQAVQLPFYFKLGYAKAKFISIIPFAALMAGYMAFTGFLGGMSGLGEALNNIFAADWYAYLAAGVAFLVIVFASYRLSLAFYKKREF